MHLDGVNDLARNSSKRGYFLADSSFCLCGFVSPRFKGLVSAVIWALQQFGDGPLHISVTAPSLEVRITLCACTV